MTERQQALQERHRFTPNGCMEYRCRRGVEFAVEAGPSTFGACMYHLPELLLEPDGEGGYDGAEFTVRVLAKEDANVSRV